MGFSVRDRLDLLAISARSEESLGTKRIDECFAASFFETNCSFMWATTFAFQPWHSAVDFKRTDVRWKPPSGCPKKGPREAADLTYAPSTIDSSFG